MDSGIPLIVIKLVACDMDGTFLRSDRKAHPANLAAVNRLLEHGITFAFATGRIVTSVRTYMTDHGIQCPIVSGNGSLVIGQDGTVIFESVLAEAAVQDLLDYAEKCKAHVNLYHGDTVWFSKNGPYADLYRRRTGCQAEVAPWCELRSRTANKVLFVDLPHRIATHQAELSAIAHSYGISAVSSEPDYLEFLPEGVNKGVGVRHLAESLGLDRHEVAAIGDWHNDLEMLEYAGFAAAVENAAPEIKAISDMVFSSNDNGGVAEFINTVIESNAQGRIRA